MTIEFYSFGSGSNGNCYMVKDDKTSILIDAGLSGKRIFESLDVTSTPRESVAAILVTHEHIDHVKSLPIVSKKIPGLQIYANEKTWARIERPVAEERKEFFNTGEEFSIGAFRIKPFAISHDAAEPVGFSLRRGDKQITLCTDVGYISEEIHDEMVDADILLLEANHEKEMLLFSSYAYSLKQRILGDRGHLSNASCGQCLRRLIKQNPKKRTIILGHLSHENNTPELAHQAVRNILEEDDIFLSNEIKLEVAKRNELSRTYSVKL